MDQLDVVSSGSDVLYVHLACGATLWRDATEPIADVVCDVCDPQAEREPDALWRRVYAYQSVMQDCTK